MRRTLVVCSADHVFNMDLAPVVEEHVAAGRVATVLTSEVTKKDASDNVVVLAGRDGTVTGVEHKPSRPSAGTVATEIFLYDTEAPAGDAARPASRAGGGGTTDGDSGIGDFGEHLLPRLVETGQTVAVPLTGYWRDVGQPEPLPAVPPRPARREGRRLRPPRPAGHLALARPSRRPRAGAGGVPRLAAVARLRTSPASSSGSVLGPGVVVEKGAEVHDSVVMEDCVIRAGCGGAHRRPRRALRGAREVAGRRGAVARALAHDDDVVLVGRDSTGRRHGGRRRAPRAGLGDLTRRPTARPARAASRGAGRAPAASSGAGTGSRLV